jgi:hypothetical protein
MGAGAVGSLLQGARGLRAFVERGRAFPFVVSACAPVPFPCGSLRSVRSRASSASPDGS